MPLSKTRCALLSAGIALVASYATARGEDAPVEIQELSGARTVGVLREFSSKRVVLGDRPPKAFARETLIAIRFPTRKPLKKSSGAKVLLANADVLHVTPTTIDEEFLTARWNQFAELAPIRIPLESVRGIVLQPPSDQAARNRLTRAITEPTLTSDLIILKNRDKIAGRLSGLSSGRFSIERSMGETVVAQEDALALAFNPELVSFPKARGRTLMMTLRDGSRIELRQLLSRNNGRFSCQTLFGAELTIEAGLVRSIRFLGGPTVYLSDLTPADVSYTPLFEAIVFPMQINRNVDGGPLKIRGREFARGLGMHSKTSASWKLGKSYHTFQASVGIDDVSNGAGSAVFSVLLDGKPAWRSRELTGRDEAVVIPRLDVSSADQLTLVVEFGQLLDVGDHADWGNPLLIR